MEEALMGQSIKTMLSTAAVVAIAMLGTGYGFRAITHHSTPAPAPAATTMRPPDDGPPPFERYGRRGPPPPPTPGFRPPGR
jgi:hypothetical protein